MHRGLVAFAILMLATPAVAAQEHERVVWEDGIHAGLVPGGTLDLLELRMWEADLRDEGPGVMLRFLMESRNSTLGGPDAIHVNGTILGTSKSAHVHLWSEDHRSWQSEHRIFLQESSIKQLPEGLPYPVDAWEHDVWVFLPLEDLGAQVEQRIDGFVFDAYAVSGDDWSQVDTAPGGYWAFAEAELPEPGAVPEANALSATAKPVPSYFLGGAGHHLNVTGAWEDGILTLVLRNPYNDTLQRLDILAPEGAKPLGVIPSQLKGGESALAVYQVPQSDEAQELLWDIRSHFGGVALMELSLDALPPVPEPEPKTIIVEVERKDPVVREPKETVTQTQGPDTQAPGKDSPLGAVALLAIAGVAVALRRRW